jgi:hypothetical protein
MRGFFSCVGYWDRKQRCARLFQVAHKRTTVETESLGEEAVGREVASLSSPQSHGM